MTRLSDEQLDGLQRFVDGDDGPHSKHLVWINRAIAEIRERRAASDRVAERLLFCMYIYSGYRIGDSRGPNGCMFDALNASRPDIAAELAEGAFEDEVYAKYFDAETEAAR